MSSDPHMSDMHPAGDVLVAHEVREPRQFAVIMHNDDYTTMEFVVGILMDVFRKNVGEAQQIMQNVHDRGRGECGVYTAEVAETKVAVVHAKARAAGFPLRCSLEEV